ncbi:MAG TPA: DUF2279 domain-containing protein [Ignavibacteriaceae bacterium]|nr:DUF2279 domain-containing protein [Ignavibacteriaceae bacterium]
MSKCFVHFLILIFLLAEIIFAQVEVSSDSLLNITDSREYKSFQLEKSYLSKMNHISPEIPEINFLQKEINYPILIGLGTGIIGSGVAVHLYQANAWWKSRRTKFHFQNDWDYSLWIDKVGHTYGTMIIGHGIASGLEAANLDTERSIIYGSLTAFAYQIYVEIEDGFGPEWGFSPGDALFDFIGGVYPIAQYYYPYLKNFQLKFSYYPRQLNEKGLIAGQKHIIIDDYEGQKFWLAVRMKEVLPKDISKYWPGFLNLALGMGVTGLDGTGNGQRNFYLALDFDTEWIPLFGPYWQFVKNTFNYFHFPMPGIRLTNNVVFLGLCY